MSASYYASVVYGFVIDQEKRTFQVKKFNENTGEPYLKDVSRRVVIVGDTVFDDEDSYDEIFCDGTFEGLDISFTTKQEQGVVGKSIGKTEDMNYCQDAIKLPTLNESDKIKIDEVAKKYGVSASYYLVPYCSF